VELLPKTLLNSGHRLCGTELEHTKRFLGLIRHFIAMSIVALQVVIIGSRLTLILAYATNIFLSYSFYGVIKGVHACCKA
jgi:hypothetical protein